MVTPNYYLPPPPSPQYKTKRAIYEEKIKRQLEAAKRNNKYRLLLSILSGIFGVYSIVTDYYSGKLFQLSEIPIGVIWLMLSFSLFYIYITKWDIKWVEKCLSPVNAMSLYKERSKRWSLIIIGGIIITFLCFGFFQDLAVQKPGLYYSIGLIGIVMVIGGLAWLFYCQIKIKECQKYI